MTDELQSHVIAIVQDTLREESGRGELVVTPEDTMDSVPEWDSMSFMKVFLAINEVYGINPDFDEAIHYTSISTLTEFLRSEIAQ
jgi:acyl carrier protein